MKYRKKPVVIEAVQLRWDNWGEMCEHAGVGKLADGKPEGVWVRPDGSCYWSDQALDKDIPGALGLALLESQGVKMGLAIPTLEGLMVAREGDWVIRGVAGELYPCKPDIFEATYEPVTELGSAE